ncbi:hypothetical protein HPB48_020285 [Haemaphysalis longicornis]|uniref:Uncharacterized protein n=1 Tax=Haemaphysalis longicornis TaxID=44386 RepID=A0A9J6FY23_HAELO|nr:hypothetical protein HPB48_020285 [Haemaphysalis longicornis]
MKLFSKIQSTEDCVNPQKNICDIAQWCIKNCSSLNTSKTKITTVSRQKAQVLFSCKVRNEAIFCVNVIKDLGVVILISFN